MTQSDRMPPDDDLLWLAYRFSAGELPAAEAEAFQARLAADQAAREALAAAVGLSETVYALERDVQRAPQRSGRRMPSAPPLAPAASLTRSVEWRRSWLQPAGWVAVGVAACLALTVAWQTFRTDRVDVAQQVVEPNGSELGGSKSGGSARPEPVDEETRLLLALLDEAHAADATVQVSSFVPEEIGEPEFGLVLDDGTADDGSLEDQNMTPDWLLAAVEESKS